MITAPCWTVTSADALLPAPPSFDVMFPVTLCWSPRLVPATFTPNVHDPWGGSVAPDSVMLLVPVEIEPPPHDPIRTRGLSVTIPDGNVSEKLIPVSGTPFGLTMLNIRFVVAPSEIKLSVKVLTNSGGLFTLQLAL